jgi:hypothetical protein
MSIGFREEPRGAPVASCGSIVHNASANGIACHGQGASRQGRTQVGSDSGR